MGFMDKLKNIFFEEDDDEDEIEEKSSLKENIKEKEKETILEKKEKVKEMIAKKVELPKKEIKEDIEEAKEVKVEEKPIEITKETVKEPKKEFKVNTELIFDDDDFILDTVTKPKKEEIRNTNINTNINTKVNTLINNKKNDNNLYKVKEQKKSDNKYDYQKSVYTPKKEETKAKTFTPSPIISPIYGILDKNYKKEEVKENKEIRISSRPSRMDVDSIRNKAFGELEYDLFENSSLDDGEEKKDVIKEENNKNIIDKRHEKTKRKKKKVYNKNEESKPTIEKVTLGEADEYYNDLGLAYNTDYKDLSKDLSDGKVVETEKSDKLEDNLFDLIESMYDKED